MIVMERDRTNNSIYKIAFCIVHYSQNIKFAWKKYVDVPCRPEIHRVLM